MENIMKRVLIFTLGFVLVLATTGFAMHHGGGMKGDGMKSDGMHHGNKWWQKPSVAGMINLSADEEGKVSDLWIQHRRKMIKLKGNLHLEEFEVEVLDDKKDFDVPALRKQFEKVQQIRSDIDAERFNYRMEVRSILGSERFLKIRSHFPMYGKDKMKGGKGMQCMGGGKGMHGMGGGKGGMHGRGDKSGGMKMDTQQEQNDAGSSSTQSDSQ